MVLEAKTDAPELALDGSTQAGFCKWFLSLPQVRLWACSLRQHSALHMPACGLSLTYAHHACFFGMLQDPQVIKFFDRKVCGTDLWGVDSDSPAIPSRCCLLLLFTASSISRISAAK